jgi:hypothetical protein
MMFCNWRWVGKICHLHEFSIGRQRFGKPDPMERTFGGPRTASERTARLFSVLGRAGAKAVYTYDFGDSWEHQIVVEKCLAPEPGRVYPACLAGERHGPPKTAAAYLGSTTCWKRSATRSMRSTKICWTGLAAALLRSHFPSMQSINGCKISFALFGRKPLTSPLPSGLRSNRKPFSRGTSGRRKNANGFAPMKWSLSR